MNRATDFAFNLYEATFSGGVTGRVETLIIKMLEKYTGFKYTRYAWQSAQNTSKGRKVGSLYFYGGNKALRLNWARGGRSATLESVDIWTNIFKHGNPYVTASVASKNAVGLVWLLIDLVQDPTIGKFYIPDISSVRESFHIGEARGIWKETREALEALGISEDEYNKDRAAYRPLIKHFKETGKAPPGFAAAEVEMADRGDHEASPELVQAAEEAGEQAKKAVGGGTFNIDFSGLDPEKMSAEDRMKDMEMMYSSFLKGNLDYFGGKRLLVVSGSSGIGKSYTLDKMIKDMGMVKGEDYLYYTAKGVSEHGVIGALWRMRNGGVIIFDDANKAFSGGVRDAIMAATDTTKSIVTKSGRGFVPMSDWDPSMEDEGKIPEEFEFNGQIIMITNRGLQSVHQAIRSRAVELDLHFTDEQYTELVLYIAGNGKMRDGKAFPSKVRKDVRNLLENHLTEINEFMRNIRGKVVDPRTVLGMLGARLAAEDQGGQFMGTTAGGIPQWVVFAIQHS